MTVAPGCKLEETDSWWRNRNMKKILFDMHSLTGGGAERVATIWAGKFAELGHEVTFLLIAREKDEYPVNDKVRIEVLSQSVKEYLSVPQLKRLWAKRKRIQAIDPDIVVSFLPLSQVKMMFILLGVRVKRINCVRINPWIAYRRRFKKLYMMPFSRADAIIVQTDEQSTFFDEKIRKKCITVSNPLAKEFLEANCEYREDVKKLVAAGRFTAQKNYPMMIKAFASAAKDTDTVLEIYGTGSDEYTEKLNALITECGCEDKIKLMGRTTDMRSALESADAFIMTSDYEGMPNALAEAMSVGLPVISTDCKTGPKDMIKNGENGFLVPVGDENAAAEAIKKLISMPRAEREKVGKAAQADIRELCNDEKNIKRLAELIENI